MGFCFMPFPVPLSIPFFYADFGFSLSSEYAMYLRAEHNPNIFPLYKL